MGGWVGLICTLSVGGGFVQGGPDEEDCCGGKVGGRVGEIDGWKDVLLVLPIA